jgi:hypothetical protein
MVKAWLKLNGNKMHYNLSEGLQRITGKSDRYGRQLLDKIRQHFAKKPHQFVSTGEFCLFSGLNTKQVTPFLE